MKVSIDPHTIDRAAERGASEAEILEVLSTGVKQEAKNSRWSCFKVFPFAQYRQGKYYDEKRIEVIFVEENETIITITVYVYYGKWNNG